jgi:hypothetical protein
VVAEEAIRELHDPGDAGLQGQRLGSPLREGGEFLVQLLPLTPASALPSSATSP